MEIIILILIIAIIAIQIYTKVNDKTKLTETLEDISFMINNPKATIKLTLYSICNIMKIRKEVMTMYNIICKSLLALVLAFVLLIYKMFKLA